MIMVLLLALSCGDATHTPTPDEEPAMPYDVTDGSSATRFEDGQTPIAAEWLNSCVVDFNEQNDAIVSKDAPDVVCISETTNNTASGLAALDVEFDIPGGALFDIGIESTGGVLLVQRVRSATLGNKLRRITRRTLAIDELLEENGALAGDDISCAVATDGELLWRTSQVANGVEAFSALDLAAGPLVEIATTYAVRDIATNGAQVFVTTAQSGTPANNQIRAFPRAGGAALWSIASPWASAHATTQLAIACDGARAYVLGDLSSTGAKVRVRAVAATTGATLWTYAPAYEHADAGSYRVRQRIASNGELVAVLTSRRLIVLNALDGAELWTVNYTDPTLSAFSPSFTGLSLSWGAGGVVYVGRAGAATLNGVFAYDGATGRALWSNTTLTPLAMVQDGAGLFVVRDTGAALNIARISCCSGPQLMQRANGDESARRPWPKLLIPSNGGR